MRITLDPKDLPEKWYNVAPDLGFTPPTLMSSSGYPLGRHDLEPLAPSGVIKHELEEKEREPRIPEKIRRLYSEWRPTSLFRAQQLEEHLETPARLYYKYEGGSSSGSHEANTAIAQAYYASRDDDKLMVTATGNGEWGASLAFACNYFGIKCKVYMVSSSYQEKVLGRFLMEVLGAEVVSSPSDSTRTGKKALSQDPQTPGSLSLALSEAYEEAASNDDAKFSWGTIMNHVVLHQTIIGLEARLQMRKARAKPDIIIAAVGGGTAFGGLVFPFYRERKRGMRMIAVETAAVPSLTKGRYAYDYGDAEGFSPLFKMYTLGHSFVPPGIKAGGMRYHGISPLVSAMYREKRIEAKSYSEHQALEAAITFAQTEGFVPSPESAYAVKAAIDEALACKARKERKNILFLINAHSNLEIDLFKRFLEGTVEEHPFQESQVQTALEKLPQVAI